MPFVILFLPIVWWALWVSGRRDAPQGDVGRDAIEGQLRALGPISRGEWAVLSVFAAACALWISSHPLTAVLQPPLDPAFDRIKLHFDPNHVEAGIALLATLTLFCIPVGRAA